MAYEETIITLPDNATTPEGFNWGALTQHAGRTLRYLIREDGVSVLVDEREDLSEVDNDVDPDASEMTEADVAARIGEAFGDIDASTGDWVIGSEVEGGDTIDTYDTGTVTDLRKGAVEVTWFGGAVTWVAFDGVRELGTDEPPDDNEINELMASANENEDAATFAICEAALSLWKDDKDDATAARNKLWPAVREYRKRGA